MKRIILLSVRFGLNGEYVIFISSGRRSTRSKFPQHFGWFHHLTYQLERQEIEENPMTIIYIVIFIII